MGCIELIVVSVPALLGKAALMPLEHLRSTFRNVLRKSRITQIYLKLSSKQHRALPRVRICGVLVLITLKWKNTVNFLRPAQKVFAMLIKGAKALKRGIVETVSCIKRC